MLWSYNPDDVIQNTQVSYGQEATEQIAILAGLGGTGIELASRFVMELARRLKFGY